MAVPLSGRPLVSVRSPVHKPPSTTPGAAPHPDHIPLSELPLVDLLDELGEQGACRFDPELHTGPDAFEDESLPERRAREDVAKEVCESCPVWATCLEYALRVRPKRGIVTAGYTGREFAELARAARKAVA